MAWSKVGRIETKPIHRGVIYFCIGEKYQRFVSLAIKQLISTGWRWPIIVYSNSEFNCEAEVKTLDGFEGEWKNRLIKMSLWDLTPFHETLFLDADTIVAKDISDIWDFLTSDFSIAIESICKKMVNAKTGWISEEERVKTLEMVGADSPCFNSGVFLFRRTKLMQDMFAAWRREWKGIQDQRALKRALHICQISPGILPNSYNFMVDWHISNNFLKRLKGYMKSYHILHLYGERQRFIPFLLDANDVV